MTQSDGLCLGSFKFVAMCSSLCALQGQDDLLEMKVGDKINYMKIVDGLENLKLPK